MGHTDSLPSHQKTTIISAEMTTAVALIATLTALRPTRAEAMDINSAMGSFGGNATSSQTPPVNVGVEQPIPPASLTQFMATPGIRQAGPLTHGF